MLFGQSETLINLSLMLLRLVIALIFLSSGWSHLTRPVARAEDIGMPTWATAALGLTEVAAAICLALGVVLQIAAALLSLVMLGAIYKKVFVWHTGFWGGESNGWYYDILYLVANLVLLATSGGAWTLT